MKLSAKNKKVGLFYIFYIASLSLVIALCYKIFTGALNFNYFIREAKYFIALHTRHAPEKKGWLKKWKDTAGAFNEMSYLVHVPYLMFQYTPSIRNPFLNTNDMGFRGTDDYSHLPSIKPDDNYRYIVLLGGSSAFGAFSSSDDKCISGQLERMLNGYYKTGKPFKVINLGMGFYNSFQELTSYILYGLKFNPQAVITFDGFNDATIFSHEGKRVPLAPGNYYYTKEILSKINTLSLKIKRKPSFFTDGDQITSWDKESSDFINDVVSLYKRNLDLICLISRENKAGIILALQPIMVRKDGKLAWSKNREELEMIYQLMPGAIQEVAHKYQARFINFQEIFSKDNDYNDYFSYTDPVHLIDKGQEIIARYLFDALKDILDENRK